MKYKHSCPSTNEDENFHFGDIGNIIANNEGKAFLSIVRKISLKSLNGRLIIITNSPDKCKENLDSDKLSDVLAIGQLNVFKPAIVEKGSGSQEYFLREINAVNKEEFDNKNNLSKVSKLESDKKNTPLTSSLNSIKDFNKNSDKNQEKLIKESFQIKSNANPISNDDKYINFNKDSKDNSKFHNNNGKNIYLHKLILKSFYTNKIDNKKLR